VKQVSSSEREKVNIFLQQEKEKERERKKDIIRQCFPNLRCLAHPILHVYSCFMMMRKEKDLVFSFVDSWWFFFPFLVVLRCRSSVGLSAENHLRAAAGTRHCCIARLGK
jgi:hypothetical protein